MPRLSSACVPLIIALAVAGCAKDGGPVATATGDKPQGEHANPAFEGVRHIMRAKLAHAQAILEGLATQRMDQIESNANALANLSELAQWQVHRTMEYSMYSDDFRWNAKELARHAKERKLHAAALDYMQLTMSCVRCHDYMSQAGLVKIDLSPLLSQGW